jgi:hypothetical protein
MRLSTASLIIAYVATLAVQALPVDSNNDLTLRSAEIDGAPVARGLAGIDLETREDDLEARDPKKYLLLEKSNFNC